MDKCEKCRDKRGVCIGDYIVCVNCHIEVCRRFHCYMKCCMCEGSVCDDCLIGRKITDGHRIFQLFWCKRCSNIYVNCSFCGEETYKFTLRKYKLPNIFDDTIYKYYYWCNKCEESFENPDEPNSSPEFVNSPHPKRKRDEVIF